MESEFLSLIEAHNYRIMTWQEAASGGAPLPIVDRAYKIIAERFAVADRSKVHVLYDAEFPDGSITDEAYVLVGTDPEQLARECITSRELEA